MKILFYDKSKLCFIMLIFFITAIGASAFDAAGPIRVAVIPFKINAEKDLTFLKDGIFDMFAFHLSREGRVKVINREDIEKILDSFSGTLNEVSACKIGSELKADYVLFGSLTVFGNSVSIHANLADVAGKRPPLTFFDQARKMDEVIPKINRFATNINERFFVQEAATTRKKPLTPELDVRPQPDIMPEKTDQKKSPNPSFIVTQTRKTSEEFWKSRVFDHLVNGMALGDVDGDGKIETVVITPDAVHIYRAEKDRLNKIKVIESRHKNFIGTDIADINGNGHPEIFVTSLNAHRSGVCSFVLEWDGKDYVRIVKDSPWYYRVVALPGQGSVLLGQKNTADTPFSGKIFEMSWENSTYIPGKQAASSKWNSLMGFTLGDVMGNGQTVAVAYNEEDYIRITDPSSGSVLWKGGDRYGGSMQYYLMQKTERGTDNRQYLPMRLLINDIDADGKNEVITARNYDMIFSLLKNFRKFTDTQIESLFWDGIGLAANWKTHKISGHISDFAIGDFDNDGSDELVAAVIIKDGDIIGTSPQSVVVAYNLK